MIKNIVIGLTVMTYAQTYGAAVTVEPARRTQTAVTQDLKDQLSYVKTALKDFEESKNILKKALTQPWLSSKLKNEIEIFLNYEAEIPLNLFKKTEPELTELFKTKVSPQEELEHLTKVISVLKQLKCTWQQLVNLLKRCNNEYFSSNRPGVLPRNEC